MEWRDRDTESKKAKCCGRYGYFFDLACSKTSPIFSPVIDFFTLSLVSPHGM